MMDVPQAKLTVAPTGGRLPLQNIQAPAAAFGATTAAAGLAEIAKQTGVAADELADHAQRFQALNNKQAVDERVIALSQAADHHINDFQANNRGMNAYTNLEDKGFNPLEDIRSNLATGLSPDAAAQYDSASRRLIVNAQASMRSFAQSQRYDSIVGTNAALIHTAQGMAAAQPDNPVVLNESLETIGKTNAAQADLQGWSPDKALDELHKSVGAIFQGQIRGAIDAGDYPKAEKIFDERRTDMTLEQINSINGALKVGHNAFVANQFTSDLFNGETAEVPGQSAADPNAPRGIRNNNPLNITNLPAGEWQGQTGKDGRFAQFATSQDGWRAAHRNLEAKAGHGLNTLEGIIGDEKWGWAPQSDGNNVAAYVASVSEATGFKPDQKVNLHDSKTREKILSAMAEVELGRPYSPRGESVAQFSLGSPAPATDPDKYVADGDAHIVAAAHVRFADNPVQETQAINAAHARLMLNAQQLRANQSAAYSRLAGAVIDGNLQDGTALSTAYPGATGDLTILPPKYQNGLKTDLQHNANELTPARQLTIQELEGKKALAPTNPAPFLGVNIPGLDLPPSVKLQYMKAQADVQNKVTKQIEQSTTISRALSSVQGQAALGSLSIKKTDSGEYNPLYYQFAGALQAEYEAFTGAYGHAPKPKDMDLIISHVTAKVGARPGGFLGIGGSPGVPAFQVPEDAAKKILDFYHSKGLGEPTPEDIGRMYRQVSRGK